MIIVIMIILRVSIASTSSPSPSSQHHRHHNHQLLSCPSLHWRPHPYPPMLYGIFNLNLEMVSMAGKKVQLSDIQSNYDCLYILISASPSRVPRLHYLAAIILHLNIAMDGHLKSVSLQAIDGQSNFRSKLPQPHLKKKTIAMSIN